MAKRKPGPKLRHDCRIQIVCPAWLKCELEAEADRLDLSMSVVIRERLAAPYRKRERSE